MKTLSRSFKAALVGLMLSGCQSVGFQSVEVPTFANDVPLARHNQRLGGAVEIRYLEAGEFEKAMSEVVGHNQVERVKQEYQVKNVPLGFAIRDQAGDCILYMERKPANANDAAWFYILGHEVFHCFMPDFH